MATVFLSYRRDDGAAYAGRLYDRLASRFGAEQIFMDIDHIEPGADFVEVIKNTIGVSKVLLVLIGPHWATMADQAGSRRLDNPEDFVRLEVSAALDQAVRVIPVLIGGATMPGPQDVPQALHPLTRRQAVLISDLRFHSDVDRLIDAIEKIVAPTKVQSPKTRARSAIVVNDVNFDDSENMGSSYERRQPGTGIARPPSARNRPYKLWIRRFPVLAAAGFIASLGFAWLRGAEVSNGVSYPYISSPGFWEVDVWLLWPFLTLLFGVLFAIRERVRDRKSKLANLN